MPRIVYHRKYNLGFPGLERLHPFDIRKYGRVWRVLKSQFGKSVSSLHLAPKRPANFAELQLVHTADYLSKLKDPLYAARALEIALVAKMPHWMVDQLVLQPMRWATRGTILAAREALQHGFAVNLAGGYHHAKPNRGEGFSIYSDIGIAIQWLRQNQQLCLAQRIAYIDTDAHQGNGVCHTFMYDSSVFIFDIFNSQIYPMMDVEARQRVDCAVPVNAETTDQQYMSELENRLPGFLDSVQGKQVGLAIYNAGTDISEFDRLGGLKISADTIYQRDLFVFGELRRRNIPTVMVLSGGYSKSSYRLVADSVIGLIQSEL